VAWPNHVENIIAAAEQEKRTPLLSLAQFFDGNEDVGSLGCNLDEHPGLEKLRSKLQTIADNDQVEGIWFQISDSGRDNPWPFCDTVWVATSVDEATLAEWVVGLDASAIIEPHRQNGAHWIQPPEGMRLKGIWWD
jgi:hypothetical protein